MEIIATVDDKDLLTTLDRLQSLSTGKGDILPKALEKAGATVGVRMEAVFAEYPQRVFKPLPLFYDRTAADGSTYKSKFKSRRQQAFVMALAKRGKIPYVRTGTLGREYQYQVTVTGLMVRVNVRSNAPYSRYVIGDDQNHFLATLGWQNEEEKLRQREQEFTDLFTRNLQLLATEIEKQLTK